MQRSTITNEPSQLTSAQISDRLGKALARLFDRDADLLKRDVNERSITHRLAIYVEEKFPEWFVDCEFNKHGDGVKEIKNPDIAELSGATVSAADTDAISVFLDIIVHGRTRDANFLAIEVKKTTRAKSVKDFDQKKLEAYRDELGYAFTAFLVLPTGKHYGDKPYIEVHNHAA